MPHCKAVALLPTKTADRWPCVYEGVEDECVDIHRYFGHVQVAPDYPRRLWKATRSLSETMEFCLDSLISYHHGWFDPPQSPQSRLSKFRRRAMIKKISTFTIRIPSPGPTPESRRGMRHRRLTISSRSIAREIERTKNRKILISRCGISSSL